MRHANLTPERWSKFTLGQQLLMIANEMNRATQLHGPGDGPSLKLALERVLNLVDATVAANTRPGLWRELLRWRDLVAEQYVAAEPDPIRHGTIGTTRAERGPPSCATSRATSWVRNSW